MPSRQKHRDEEEIQHTHKQHTGRHVYCLTGEAHKVPVKLCLKNNTQSAACSLCIIVVLGISSWLLLHVQASTHPHSNDCNSPSNVDHVRIQHSVLWCHKGKVDDVGCGPQHVHALEARQVPVGGVGQ